MTAFTQFEFPKCSDHGVAVVNALEWQQASAIRARPVLGIDGEGVRGIATGVASIDSPRAAQPAFAHQAAKVGIHENVTPRGRGLISRTEIDHVLKSVFEKAA